METNERPVLMIEGERLALGPLRRDLMPYYQRLMNDLETLRFLGRPPLPITLEAQEAWYASVATSASDVVFAVYERPGLAPIGAAGLNGIEHREGKAKFGIWLEPAARDRGLGTEATRLVLDYAFTALGLRNVMLSVWDYNPGAVRAYEKAGFRLIGRRRRCRRLGNTWHDEILMDAVADEFESPVLAKVFVPEPEKR